MIPPKAEGYLERRKLMKPINLGACLICDDEECVPSFPGVACSGQKLCWNDGSFWNGISCWGICGSRTTSWTTLGLFSPLHLSTGRFPCGATLVEKGSVILLWEVKKCGGNHETWRSDRWLSWKTALETALCLGYSCKRGSPVGTAASLLKHGQSFAEIPICQPDGTEICSDASETVLAST